MGRFDKAKFEYLHSQKFELYREFLLIDKLAEHCENIEKQADKMYEKLFQKYLNDHDVPNGDDFFASTSMFEQADRWAREIVINNVICN